MLSYLNDKTLKRDMVSEMRLHAEQDQLIKGTYSKMNGKFKGCAVGCGVDSLNRKRNLKISYDDHKSYGNALGIPEWLARLEDTLFEGLPDDEAKDFPIRFLEAIPVGKDLEPVKWKFCAFIMKENIERVLSLNIKDDLKKQVVNAIRGVLNLHEEAIKSGEWNESARSAAESAAESAARSAWSAEYAAWSAWSAAESAARSAWSAAESAARSAWSAESAARSAWSAEYAAWSAWSAEYAARSAWSAEYAARSAWSAEYAARSAAYTRYANELIRLLQEA